MAAAPNPPAVSDAAAAIAWAKIVKLAEDHQLISMAYGGVMVVVTPEQQRRGGARERILRAHVRSETPPK